MSHEPSEAAPANPALVIIALIALFAAAFASFAKDNRFPFFYHPNEYGKARQVVEGARTFNFSDPLLLLNVTRPLKVFWKTSAADSKPVALQKAAEAGRTTSALFAAITVVSLALAGYILAGPGGGLGAGCAALFNPQLFENAHFFKEDTALAMGFALTVLASALFWKKPACGKRAAFLGFAVAVAISAKYIGITALAIALPVVAFAPGEKRARRIAIFFGALVFTVLIFNAQALSHAGVWWKGFRRELGLALSAQRGVSEQNPIAFYKKSFGESMSMTAVIFLALNAFNLVTTTRRRSLADWLIFLFPFAFTAILMRSPRVSDLYFFPAAILFNFSALVGVGIAAEWFTRAFGKLRVAGQCAFALLALFIGWSGEWTKYREVAAQFKVDDRHELETWMNANLPAGGVVVQDYTIHLPDAGDHRQEGLARDFKMNVSGSEFVADLGTLDSLRARGVRYVVTSPRKSRPYIDGGAFVGEESKDEFERRKSFYTSLPQQAKLIKKWDIQEIDTLHPGIELYDIGEKP